MPKITINNLEIEVAAGMTVLQACEQAGVEIPRFCYHERLSIAGNCRMCLVEVAPGPPKPQASCALPVAEGQVIKTNSPMVEKARKGVMEFLLINHPLDCPICDQGGECDLQDQAVAYGSNLSRYREAKRSVEDKYMGPLVKTIMNRCIHCTRCVRFVSEVAGVDAIGLLNRGINAEISALEMGIASELSGNVVDLCPVGALTSKPYSYQARSWELSHTPSIDVTDGQGANIQIDTRGNEVMRILPRLNEAVNEEWISDKARHSCDGLKRQRLDRPYIRNQKGKLEAASWQDALAHIATNMKGMQPKKMAAITGDLVDVESQYALKLFMQGLGVDNIDCRQDGAYLPSKPKRQDYLFNSTIQGIEDMDVLLIIGSDIRKEAAVLNSRIRKRYLTGKLKIAYIGKEADLTYDALHLGEGSKAITQLLQGKGDFAKLLKVAEKPALILGGGCLTRSDAAEIYAASCKIADQYNMVKEGWNGFNLLNLTASRVGGLDIGFYPSNKGMDTAAILAQAKAGKLEFLYLLGADEIDTAAIKDCFVVYQGHHGDKGAHIANVILPGAAYSEKDATYVNLEGRVQQALQAIFPPGEAKQDWAILRALSEVVGSKLEFNSLAELRTKLYQEFPHLAGLDQIIATSNYSLRLEDQTNSDKKMDEAGLTYPIQNFYMTDAIGRSSETMAKCTAEFILKKPYKGLETMLAEGSHKAESEKGAHHHG